MMDDGPAKSQEVSVESRGDWGTFFDAAKKLSRPISLDRADSQAWNTELPSCNRMFFKPIWMKHLRPIQRYPAASNTFSQQSQKASPATPLMPDIY
ncbi:MAG: hypothetical protein AB1547_07145, partial [Thermodesulfobacteriota bacterium]